MVVREKAGEMFSSGRFCVKKYALLYAQVAMSCLFGGCEAFI